MNYIFIVLAVLQFLFWWNKGCVLKGLVFGVIPGVVSSYLLFPPSLDLSLFCGTLGLPGLFFLHFLNLWPL